MGLNFNGAPRALPLEDADARTARISNGLKQRARDVVKHLFPAAIFSSSDARIGDVYGTKGSSLSIALRPFAKAGMWKDHATGEGGDIISLWGAAQGLDFVTTLRECDAWLGGNVTPIQRKYEKKRSKQKAQPKENTTKKQEAEYLYTDTEGNKICTVFRYGVYNEAGARIDKAFSIFRYSDHQWKAPEVRPLYRLPDISEAEDVILVEGEKCADALAGLGLPSTTASGGSNTILANTDWTPLAGKSVYVWPDNDAPGEKFAASVVPILTGLGCIVHLVPVPEGKPPGWDAADAVQAGENIKAILRAGEVETPPHARSTHERWRDIEYQYEGELVEDLFPRTGVGTIFGESTAGKTFVVLDIASRIAAGARLFDKETEPCGILYCAFEGYSGLKKRVHGIKTKRNIVDVEIDIIDAPWLINDERQYSVFEAELEKYRQEFDSRGVRLGIIIIDTLTSATAGSDTNSQSDVTAAMKRLKRTAAAMDLLIINVGHTGKDRGKGMVGSFAYKSEADFFLECRVKMNEETGQIERRSFFVEKVKEGPSGFIVADYSLEVVTVGKKPNGRDITTCLVCWHTPQADIKIVVKSESEKMLRYMDRASAYLFDGAKDVQEIANHLSVSRSRASEIMGILARRGEANSRTIGKRKIWELSTTVENSETVVNAGHTD